MYAGVCKCVRERESVCVCELVGLRCSETCVLFQFRSVAMKYPGGEFSTGISTDDSSSLNQLKVDTNTRLRKFPGKLFSILASKSKKRVVFEVQMKTSYFIEKSERLRLN